MIQFDPVYIYKGCPKINERFELNIKESFQSLDIYFLNRIIKYIG